MNRLLCSPSDVDSHCPPAGECVGGKEGCGREGVGGRMWEGGGVGGRMWEGGVWQYQVRNMTAIPLIRTANHCDSICEAIHTHGSCAVCLMTVKCAAVCERERDLKKPRLQPEGYY